MTSLILKVTEACNSACAYCDVVAKPRRGGAMTIDVLARVLSRVNELLEERPHEKVDLLWHGGEPLLLGPAVFERAWELQQELCPATQGRISHSIQTNLTLFTSAFVPAFRRLGLLSLGTSYDPEPGIRGAGSPPRTDAYNAAFLEATALLDREGLGWGVIYVVTRRSLARPLDVFHLLTNLKPSGGVNLNPVLVYGDRRELAVTPEEYVAFLGAVFPVWWRHRARYPQVEPFRSLVETVVDGRPRLGCVDSGACSHSHVNVAPDGETSQCGRSADWGLLPYGNLADRSLSEILSDAQRDALAARVGELEANDCAGCRLWGLCHGGCPLDAWAAHGTLSGRSGWCAAKRGLVEGVIEPVTGRRYEPRGGEARA